MSDVDPLHYFAANAPIEIPDWFEHQPLNTAILLKRPNWEQLPTSQDRTLVVEWLDHGCAIPQFASEAVRKFVEEYNAAEAATKEWRKLDEGERFFQWRWFYATEMVRRMHVAENLVSDVAEKAGLE